LITLIGYAFLTATFTRWLDFVLNSHPLGRKYMAQVLRLARKVMVLYHGRDKYNHTMWIAKPLGYCLYCFGTWIVIFAGLIFQNSFYEVLAIIGINHFWLKATERIYTT
jgi:hypothetical protein